jgi:hypothetical protein
MLVVINAAHNQREGERRVEYKEGAIEERVQGASPRKNKRKT